MPSVIWGAILVASTALAVRQSVHLGESMGFTGFGKESFAQWLALIDICTAVMGAGAIYAWRKGHRGWSIAVGLFAALCVVTSMTNQVGFAAWERFGSVAQREAEAKAAADAKATQLALIKQQIDWNNKTSDPKVEPPPRIKSRVGLEAYKTAEAVAAAARKETLASTERLIEKAGEFDPTKVRASVGDVHAQALSKLTRGTFGAEDIALWLAVAYSILIILAKPISGGMLVISWPGGSAPAGARASADQASLDTALPLKADAQPAAQPAPELPVLPTAPPTVAVAQDHLAPEPAVAVLRPEVQDQPAASAEPLDAESHSVELDRLGAPAAMIEVLNALDPKATTAAADEPETYDQDREGVRAFLTEMTHRPHDRVRSPATEVYQLYCQWHKAGGRGLRPVSQSAFGRFADEMGVVKSKRKDGACIEYHLQLKRSFPAVAAMPAQQAA